MSLALTWHNKEFGIVCSDGRVSRLMRDGRRIAVPQETARKFIVLRASPGLVLAGTSSISKWLDFSVYEAMRRFLEDFPEASFDQVARVIGPLLEQESIYFCRSAKPGPRFSP